MTKHNQTLKLLLSIFLFNLPILWRVYVHVDLGVYLVNLCPTFECQAVVVSIEIMTHRLSPGYPPGDCTVLTIEDLSSFSK